MFSCGKKEKENHDTVEQNDAIMTSKSQEIIDCNYTFEEAITGSGAPQKIIKELVLLDVRYYSTDNKIHKGQILTNKKIAADIVELFEFMISNHFPLPAIRTDDVPAYTLQYFPIFDLYPKRLILLLLEVATLLRFPDHSKLVRPHHPDDRNLSIYM